MPVGVTDAGSVIPFAGGSYRPDNLTRLLESQVECLTLRKARLERDLEVWNLHRKSRRQINSMWWRIPLSLTADTIGPMGPSNSDKQGFDRRRRHQVSILPLTPAQTPARHSPGSSLW